MPVRVGDGSGAAVHGEGGDQGRMALGPSCPSARCPTPVFPGPGREALGRSIRSSGLGCGRQWPELLESVALLSNSASTLD